MGFDRDGFGAGLDDGILYSLTLATFLHINSVIYLDIYEY